MDDDAKLRVGHAILNGASLKDIAETNECTIYQVNKAWREVAEKVKNPPGDYRNLREVMIFKKEWRRLLCALG